MRISSKKLVASLLAVIISLGIMPACIANAVNPPEKNYIISNPYEGIDWDTWGNYKTQLHCHTNASDGYLPIDEFLWPHYDLNFDIVALTDHGTINRGWNEEPELVPLMRLIKKDRTNMSDVIPLTDEEYEAYLNGTAPSPTRTHTNGMLDVPQGIELNMATPIADCHLTG